YAPDIVDIGGVDNLRFADQATITDKDAGESTFDTGVAAVGGADNLAEGTFTFDEDGNWSYTIPNDLEVVQSL
ncbi:VCBS domain-containing protein, partial [Vibrio sp. 10N.261.51.F12]